MKTKPEQTKLRKLSELKELPGNPRLIKDDDFERLCKSILDNPDYFQARPLILSDRTGKLIIIAGNQRYKAAKQLKLKEVPTFLIKGLTEEREKEIIIRDNISNGNWDYELLKDWNEDDLEKWGLDMPVTTEGGDPEDISDTIKTEYKIEVVCRDEEHQEKVYNKLIEDGYECRILTL
jgi:hypothetical protein